MPEPVRRLCRILADEGCWGVAVIAGRNRAVRGLEPTVILFAHHVAVGAGRGIVGQIRPAPGIHESVYTDAERDTDSYPEQDALNHARFHLQSHELRFSVILSPSASL